MESQYKHLSVEERNVIHRCRLEGQSVRAIGRTLGRPPSTVAREIARNGAPAGYDAVAAERGYRRRRAPGRRKLAPGTPLWNPVVMELYRGWSPEQIAGRRRAMYPDDPAQRVSHETIYLALYALPRGELRKALLAQLRQSHATRRPRSRGQDRRGGLRNMTSIHDRPAEVATREVPGHWEGDLIKGAGNRSAMGTVGARGF
jgi:IS30 family transposase